MNDSLLKEDQPATNAIRRLSRTRFPRNGYSFYRRLRRRFRRCRQALCDNALRRKRVRRYYALSPLSRRLLGTVAPPPVISGGNSARHASQASAARICKRGSTTTGRASPATSGPSLNLLKLNDGIPNRTDRWRMRGGTRDRAALRRHDRSGMRLATALRPSSVGARVCRSRGLSNFLRSSKRPRMQPVTVGRRRGRHIRRCSSKWKLGNRLVAGGPSAGAAPMALHGLTGARRLGLGSTRITGVGLRRGRLAGGLRRHVEPRPWSPHSRRKASLPFSAVSADNL